ncbi:MAG TPA: hypothetical protein PLU35_13570 [Phycisphaerales bacterium]|nr:hypothetical protein [Phycisphaerales bacterium]
MNITTIKRAGCAGVGAVAMVALAAPNDCYFLVSSGCGSGATFCLNNSIVCDVGYTSSVDTGCGKRAPFSSTPVQRACWKLTNTQTYPCSSTPPESGQATGCSTPEGICCHADKEFVEYVSGHMSVPMGPECCEMTGNQ